MRLPKPIQTGVKPMAQHDIQAPLRVAEGFGELVKEAGGAIAKIEEAEKVLALNDKSTKWLNDYNKFSTEITNTAAYDLNNPDIFDEDAKTAIMQEHGITEVEGEDLIVPAWQANGYLHDRYVEESMAASKEGLDKKHKTAFDKAVAPTTRKSTAAIMTKSFQQRNALSTIKWDQQYNDLIMGGDKDLALSHLKEGYQLGLIDSTVYHERINSYEGDIEYSEGMTMVMSGDPNQLAVANSKASNENSKMTTQQKYDIYSKSNSAQVAIEKSHKESKKLSSGALLGSFYAQIGESGQPLSWDIIKAQKGSLTNADYQALVKVNQIAQKSTGGQSDAVTLSRIRAKVAALSIPVEGLNNDVRKASLRNQISVLMGVNPVDGTLIDGVVAKISGEDALKLMQSIESMSKVQYNNPELKMLLDRGYTLLVGGAKSDITGLENPIIIMLAAEFETELIKASQDPNFNAQATYDRIMPRYVTSTTMDAQNEAIQLQLHPYRVREGGKINQAKTQANIAKDYRDGNISRDRGIYLTKQLIRYVRKEEYMKDNRPVNEGALP